MSRDASRTIGGSVEETREYHRRYLYAINSPVRRAILRELKDEEASSEALSARTGLPAKELEWHLSILEHGFCVEKADREGVKYYKLTKEGTVVDYMDREK